MGEAKRYRDILIEKIAEVDESLTDLFLMGGSISEEQIRKALRKATLAMTAFPVLCGASFKNKGVQTLLDAVIDYLPSPLDVPPVVGHLPDKPEKEVICKTEWNASLAALAFKIASDSFAGTLTYIRVYSGVIKAGDQIYNPREQKKERVRPAS